MVSFRAFKASGLIASFLLLGLTAGAQTLDIQKAFQSKYALTKTSDSRDDIVTAGDVIVLQKDGLVMCGVNVKSVTQNNYKNGKITQSGGSWLKDQGYKKLGMAVCSDANRKFVSGEKFWITSVQVAEDGVVFGVFSDPFNDVRYYGSLKIQFNKGQPPPAADLVALADQIFKVQPADSGGDSADNKGASPAPAAPAAAAIPPPAPVVAAVIAPPPPPAPDPIQMGQTKAAVTAAYGEPTKVIFKSAAKEIDAYPGMKVTFMHDKVTDVE